jgi:hypothetical protein
MAVIYLYDVKASDTRTFNRIKRRFYYWLNQIVPDKDLWKTKSAIMVPRKYIKPLDALFKEFKGSVICYKANVRTIEELE